MSDREYLEPVETQTMEPADQDGMTTSYLFDTTSYSAGGDICVGVAAALSSRRQRDALEMPPVGTVIDCDALELLLRGFHSRTRRDRVSVTFPYDIYLITVWADGRVLIRN